MLRTTLAAAAMVGCLFTGSAQATQWHMPTPYQDASHPTRIARAFAREVKTRSNGDLTIVVHSGASLVKHADIPDAVRTGKAQLGEILIGIMGNSHPVFKHDNIPFLATCFDDAEQLWHAARPEIEKQLNSQGMTLLYSVPWPAQSLYTRKAVSRLADLKGLKMRAYSLPSSRLAELMGTTPVTLQVPEIPQAFRTGTIDAMITSPSIGADGRAWDYLSHYTDIAAWVPKNMVVVNTSVLQRLNSTTRQVVLDAAAAAEKKGWEVVRKQASQDTRTLSENGITVTEPGAELEAELNSIGAVMIDEWKREAPEVQYILDAYNR